MKTLKNSISKIITGLLMLVCMSTFGQREMEYLNRGVVAVRSSSTEVFVSWRMLGPEYEQNATFNIYRGGVLLASNLNVTNYTDNTSSSSTYTVSAVINGTEQSQSAPASIWGNFYNTVPISPPSSNHHANDASVGDLDSDGDYEIVLKWEANNSKDNSQSGTTDVVYLDGIEMDGTRKWRINLGINIRAGAHYTQFMVYDLDGDGKAEIACKTAPGTRDGLGNYLSKGPASNDDDSADYRNSSGYILSGPEYLTIFNGETGEEMATTSYVPARGSVSAWGDSYGNRVDRFLACVAYLDGTKPSLVMCRGYYTRSVLAAWDWRNGSLTHRWTFDSNNNTSYAGQGNHSVAVNDVDNDGRDEIIYGGMAVDDDGTGLWTTGLGHGDAMHVSDIDVNRPGLEKWGIHETTGSPGSALLDARTGEILWQTANADTGRGVSADLDPSSPGMECWGGTDGLRSATNSRVGSKPGSSNFAIWWDGDLSRELCDADRIDKYENGSTNRLVTIYNYENSSTNNSTKKNPCLQADILGDWREELITRSSDNTKLIIFTTTAPTDVRMYTMMHDPAYRLGVAWQNVSYNQPPHTGFFFGNGMSAPPVPNITLINNTNQTVSGVIVSPTSKTIAVNGTVQLTATVQPGNANNKNVSWTSSNPSVATVNNVGLVTGVNYGTTTITVTTEEGSFTANSTIVVDDIATIEIQENETGFESYDGFIESNLDGYTGSGFVNTPNEVGQGINWELCAQTSGTYTFAWRYANGGSTDRTAQIIIDDAVAVSNVSFPSTSAWTSWDNTSSIDVTLDAGVHTVRLEATQASGLANIDYFSITGNNPLAGACLGTTYTLTTAVNGQGSISPSNGEYIEDTVVSITATPASGWQFDDWNGDVSGTSNPVSVTMNANTSITANFSEIQITTLTIQENETAFCGVDGSIDNNHTGFTGDGFANTNNASGNGISWSVNVPSSGTYTLAWRIANGSTTNRTGEVLVNGFVEVPNVDFLSTGGWTAWSTVSGVEVTLPAGTNSIRLQATNTSGLSNIDAIEITGANPVSESCAAQQSAKLTTLKGAVASDLNVSLYPVPVKGVLHVDFSQELTEPMDISIFDITGKLLKSNKVSSKHHSLNISELSNGCYFVIITGKEFKVQEKIVVSK